MLTNFGIRHGQVPHSLTDSITPIFGAQVSTFYARLYTRAPRPVCSLKPKGAAGAQRAFDRLDAAPENFLQEINLRPEKLDSICRDSSVQDS